MDDTTTDATASSTSPVLAATTGEDDDVPAINSSADAATAEASATPERNTTGNSNNNSNSLQINTSNLNTPPSQQQQRALSHIHVHLNTPQGVRGLNIPLPPGVTMQRTTPQGGGGVNGNASPAAAGATNNTTAAQGRHGIRITAVNNSNSSSLPPYQPLQAHPLPNQTNYDDTLLNQNNLQKLDLKQFECSICFEYMEVPVRCGGTSCSSRFCNACLQRVLREEISNRNNSQQPNNNNEDTAAASQTAKCPHCRTNFNQSTIQVDQTLQQQIHDVTSTITCPFQGCNTEIQLSKLKQHEESCPYIRMKCKYAEWGCKWTGRQMDLESHYCSSECEYNSPGLQRFIERYRKTVEHEHKHSIEAHTAQLQGVNQMQAMQSRQVMMMKHRNVANILDVMELTYNACCFPGRVVNMRDLWSSILLRQGCRTTLGNMLLSFPTLVLVVSLFFQKFYIIELFVTEYHMFTEDYWSILDECLMGSMILALGIIYLSCFYLDVKSPYEWSMFSIKSAIVSHPLIRDVAAVSVTMIYFIAFEHFEFTKGMVMWHCMTLSTVFYSSFVYAMTEKVAGSPCPCPRALSVVAFGLRYGLLTSYCNFRVESPVTCTIGVSIWLRLLGKILKLPDFITSESTECFLKLCSPAFLAFCATVWTGILAQDPYWRDELSDWFYGMLMLLYANLQIFLYSKAGEGLAKVTYDDAIQKNRIQGTAHFPNATGCSVFVVCNLLLASVALMLKNES